MDWWPELADLDRLNILSSPKEDRARLLASKYSKPVAEIMIEIGNKTDLDYHEDFEMPENPTKLLPMRLIHNYCCFFPKPQCGHKCGAGWLLKVGPCPYCSYQDRYEQRLFATPLK